MNRCYKCVLLRQVNHVPFDRADKKKKSRVVVQRETKQNVANRS